MTRIDIFSARPNAPEKVEPATRVKLVFEPGQNWDTIHPHTAWSSSENASVPGEGLTGVFPNIRLMTDVLEEEINDALEFSAMNSKLISVLKLALRAVEELGRAIAPTPNAETDNYYSDGFSTLLNYLRSLVAQYDIEGFRQFIQDNHPSFESSIFEIEASPQAAV